MTTNIEITNIDKHFFSKCFKNIEKSTTLQHNTISTQIKKYKTKLVNYGFYSINEITICEKIKKIPYCSNNYIILHDYDFVNISQLNEKVIEKLDLSNENKYLVFKYKNDNCIDFNVFIFNILKPKLFMFHIIESFSYILNSLIKLNNAHICFFNLSPQNIMFNIECGEKPQLKNFQTSLLISKLNNDYITNIIKNTNDYTHKPLEVHILFYLIQNDILTISYSLIEEICEIFVNNLSILSFFTEKYKENYKLTCIEILKKYINTPKIDIINDILSQNDKWDVYSVSVLYLHIFANISRAFSLKSTVINKITIELSKNIHPDPLKRNSLKILQENYNNIINNEKDWDFINNITSNMMPQLFDILGK